MQKKNQILNNSKSLEDSEELSEILQEDPARIVLSKMINEDAISKIESKLSKGELEVYKYLKEGYTPKEIVDIINKPAKSVDNTIQRIKAKARKLS